MTDDAGSVTLRALPRDDAVITFRTECSGVNGRLVRLGPVAEKILRPHAMPEVASQALGEALLFAALLGSALPAKGNISVQTRTSGPVSVLYADCEAPGKLRGYARFEASALADVAQKFEKREILGDGHLAITIDEGDEAERYQSVVALDGQSLEAGAAAYFEQRENLPTFIHLAVAKHYAGPSAAVPSMLNWRGGGLMIQQVDEVADETGDDPWERVRMLAATIEDHELLDPTLAPETLLLRLFHEEGVVIEKILPLSAYCKCSRERIVQVLNTFGSGELADMLDEHGDISVRCEFCAATYPIKPSEIEITARTP